MPANAGHIFLSHASEDKSLVEAIYARLDASSVFYDTRSIVPGEPTMQAMEEHVARTSVFVLFHSPHSSKAWVDFEISQARLNSIDPNSSRRDSPRQAPPGW